MPSLSILFKYSFTCILYVHMFDEYRIDQNLEYIQLEITKITMVGSASSTFFSLAQSSSTDGLLDENSFQWWGCDMIRGLYKQQ